MNREDIIHMAREAELTDEVLVPWAFEIERFAELIRKDYSFTHAQMWLKRFDDAVNAKHSAMMQLFTDPENQPTQHGTVTVEYMQREIAAERERCANLRKEVELRGKWPTEYEDGFFDGLEKYEELIRAGNNA